MDDIGAGLAKAFMSLGHFMGPGPFCVGGVPTLGDCALGTYMQLLKNLVFGMFLKAASNVQIIGYV